MITREFSSKITAEEYLLKERDALEKSEFYQGECFAMAGASRRHNRLSANMLRLLSNHLLEDSCQPYMADMRLNIEKHNHYVYPDLMVICGEDAYVKEDITNDATVLIEVLSKSTESYDRGMKFQHYQSLSSIQEYILISQHLMLVEIFHRQGVKWLYESFSLPTEKITLSSIQFSCSLKEIYHQVSLDEK